MVEFMRRVVTDIQIRAAPTGIWSILTDFPAYPDWNPFIRRIEGVAMPGDRLSVSLKPPNGRAMTFKPVVLAAVENRELRWRGRLLVPGLLDGEYYFLIETIAPNRVRFVQGGLFTGLLPALAGRSLETGTRAGFIEMNQALKSRAEHA
jgi:hypothetical protein